MGLLDCILKKESRIIDVEVKEKVKKTDDILLYDPRSEKSVMDTLKIDREYTKVENHKGESLLIKSFFSEIEPGEKLLLKIEETTYFNRFKTHSYEIKRSAKQKWEPVITKATA